MDELSRRLRHQLVKWGQLETFIIDCLEGMNTKALLRMHRIARFLAERQEKKWGDRWGPPEDLVPVMHLSDESIIRQINEPKFKSIRRNKRQEKDRSIYDLILEVASGVTH
jgi:hypothetical protein